MEKMYESEGLSFQKSAGMHLCGFTAIPGLLWSLIPWLPWLLFIFTVACSPGSNLKHCTDLSPPQSSTESSSLHFPQLLSFCLLEVKVNVYVAQSCLTLCDPMDCSPPGSSVHGILQARILGWVAISLSRGSSQPSNQTQVSCTAGRFFTVWAIRETPVVFWHVQKPSSSIFRLFQGPRS